MFQQAVGIGGIDQPVGALANVPVLVMGLVKCGRIVDQRWCFLGQSGEEDCHPKEYGSSATRLIFEGPAWEMTFYKSFCYRVQYYFQLTINVVFSTFRRVFNDVSVYVTQ